MDCQLILPAVAVARRPNEIRANREPSSRILPSPMLSGKLFERAENIDAD